MRIERIIQETQTNPLLEPDLAPLYHLIQKYKGKKGNLIPLLQGTQDIFGFIPRKAFNLISEETGLELSELFGVATFYAQFRLHPVGKYIIKVCHGTACHVQNANSISDALEEALKIKDGETTADGMFTLESVACLGCCSLAPVLMVHDEAHGKLTGNEAVRIIKNVRIQDLESSKK